ncbi:hypothetical protein DdX_18537 [Ditylenchus destructor]|uniref:Uncharacterized protein n=1 Tax=Ditylenchus destructor TaxID=166010 RepID=A0AAD4MKN5_9BILA|nr:hypothetical protein DdX_18537 [Ditylenchus destructor]
MYARIFYLYACRRKKGLRIRTFTWCLFIYMILNQICMPLVCIWRICFLFNSTNIFGLFKLGRVYKQTSVTQTVYDWTEIGHFVATGALPVSIFFLTLERCLNIQFPTKLKKIHKMVLSVASLILSPGTSLIFAIFSRWNMWPYKMTVGMLNNSSCIFLIWKMTRTNSKAKNILAKNTALMELCLEFLPNFAVFVVNILQLEDFYPYITSLPIATQCLNSLTCGILYNIRMTAQENKVIPLQPTSSLKVNHLAPIDKVKQAQRF